MKEGQAAREQLLRELIAGPTAPRVAPVGSMSSPLYEVSPGWPVC